MGLETIREPITELELTLHKAELSGRCAVYRTASSSASAGVNVPITAI